MTRCCITWLLVGLLACDKPADPRDPRDPDGDTASITPTTPITGSAQVEYDPDQAHHVWLTVSLSGPAPVDVVCTLLSEPDEQLVVGATKPLSEHRLDVYGLLGDESYACAASVGEASVAEVDVHTHPPLGLPPWTIERPGEPWGAWTLLNVWSVDAPEDQRLVVIDLDGRPRFLFPIDYADQGGIEFTWLPDRELFLAGGGNGLNPAWIDRAGVVHAQFPDPEFGQYHHDAVQLAGDEVAGMAHHEDTAPWGEPYVGFVIDQRDMTSGELTWSWTSQQAVDAGTLIPDPDGKEPDRYHANALKWVEDPDGPAWWVSLSATNRIIRIDATTGDLTWRMGVNGDFELRDADDTPLGDEEWFFFPHDPDIALPLMLVHDNGVDRTDGTSYSRVVEYEVDIEARVVRKLWEWTEPGWYETVLGGVDRLPDDHVLVTQGHCFLCEHGDPEHHSSLVELDRTTGEIVWRLTIDDEVPGLYRAERLDGCALFANRKYCPSLR